MPNKTWMKTNITDKCYFIKNNDSTWTEWKNGNELETFKEIESDNKYVLICNENTNVKLTDKCAYFKHKNETEHTLYQGKWLNLFEEFYEHLDFIDAGSFGHVMKCKNKITKNMYIPFYSYL